MRRAVVAFTLLAAACGGGVARDVPPSPTATPTGASTTAMSEPGDAGEIVDDPLSHPTKALPTPSEWPTRYVGGFDPIRAMGLAITLADEIGERVAGTAGEQAARQQVAAWLGDAGWTVEEDPFELPQGGMTANVIATLDGAGRDDGPVIVVGAHLDTVAGTVGANDNASGIGVLVAVAEELADEAADLHLPVLIVAFGAEEFQADTGVHHIGSTRLAGALADRTVAMLSIDGVGNGATTKIIGVDGYDQALVDELAAVAADAGIADVETGVWGDVSDHGPFATASVPAAFLWAGKDPNLHKPTDTTDLLDIADFQRTGDLLLAWLRGLLQPCSSSRPATCPYAA